MNRICACRGALRLALALSGLAGISSAALANIPNTELASSAPESLSDLRADEIRLRNAVDQTPNNGMLRIQLANVYLHLGNYNAGLAELTVARNLKVKDEIVAPLQAELMNASGAFADLLRDIPAGNRPPKVECVIRTYRALAQLAIGETDNARASLQDAERLDPSNTLAKVTSARLLLSQKQYRQAEQKIDQVLSMAPKDNGALELKGLMLQMRGDTAGALAYFNRAISGNRVNIQILLDRANLEATRNQLDQAEKDLAIIKKASPNSPMAAYVDAIVKARSGNYQAADEAIGKLRGSMSYFPGTYLLAGEIKFKLNQWSQAEDYLNKFIAQDQSQSEAYSILGLLALRRGDAERGVTMLEKAHSLAPQDSDTAVLLSQAYLARNEAPKAIALMDELIAHQPNNPKVEGQRALAHFAVGDPGGSLAELSNLFKAGAGQLTAGPSLIVAQLRAGKVADAARTAQALVKRDPGSLLYKELLGATLVAQRDYRAAEGIFKEVLAKDPTVLSARRGLAQIYLSTGRPDAAVAIFQDRIAKNPADTRAKEALAEIYVSRKDYANALKLLTDPAVVATQDIPAGLDTVRVYEMLHQWPDAIKAANSLQAHFPGNEPIMDTLGRVYSESGDVKSSLAAYASATDAFPKSASLWNNYATALAAGKNTTAALDAITRAHTLAPDNLNYARGMIELTYALKGQTAAMAAAQSLPNNTPQSPVGTLLVAATLERNGKRSDAITVLETAQTKTPSKDGLMMLSKYYVADQKPAKAIALLEGWAKAHPDDVDAHYGMAQLYGSTGAFGPAQQQFEWLAARRPNDPIVLNNLAFLYSQKNDPRAQGVAEKAFKLAPQSGAVADTLGWIHANHGDAAGAVKYLQIAAKAAPDDQVVQYHFAFALAKTNQAANARPILERLLQSNAAAGLKQQAKALLAKLGS